MLKESQLIPICQHRDIRYQLQRQDFYICDEYRMERSAIFSMCYRELWP